MTAGSQARMIFSLSLAAVLCLASCAGTKRVAAPGDPRYALLMRQARQAFDEGSVDRASALYELALKRAHLSDDPANIRNASFNLAMCRIRSQRFDEAKGLLDEAVSEAARLGERPADLVLAQARFAFLSGDLKHADQRVEELLSAPPPDASASDNVQAHLLKGRIFAARKDVARAREELDAAKSAGGFHGNAAVEIEARALSTEIHLLEGSPVSAARDLDAQAELLRGTSRYREMADALDRAGQNYSKANLNAEAFDRSYRAARSHLAGGDSERALESARRALSAAQAAGESDAEARARALIARIIKNPSDSP